jgi:CRP/FNR family transcriptional regulator
MAWLSSVGVQGKSGFRSEPAFSSSPTVAAPPAATAPSSARIASNAFVFKAGDPRTHLYRVESGAVCLYEAGSGEARSVIEFCFPGDYLGLGFLDKQHLNARTLLETTVTAYPIDALPDLVKDDPRAQAKLALSVEREFEARRDELASAGRRRPIERVAALLVTSARTNVQQGRPAEIIKDSWKCGFIAELLQLTLDDLTAILLDLQRRGLIAAEGPDLRLTNLAALEALADGICPDNDHGAPQLETAYRAA